MEDSTRGRKVNDQVARVRGLVGDDAVLLPWRLGSKGEPRKWKHLTLGVMSDPAHLKKLGKGNIGIMLGTQSNGLCSIDIDHDSEVDAFLSLNPMLSRSLRTKGARGCNCWFRVIGAVPPVKAIETKDGNKWGEFRGEGGQTIIYGRHPSGCDYQVVNPAQPVHMEVGQIVWPEHINHPFSNTDYWTDETEGTDETEVTDGTQDTQEMLVGVCGEIRTIEDVVTIALPTEKHSNHSHLLLLARAIKTLEHRQAWRFNPDERRAIFDRWFEKAEPFLRHELTQEDYYIEFVNSYRAAKHLIGRIAAAAWQRAVNNPLPPDCAPQFKKPEIRLLLAFCLELQRAAGDRPFFLSARTAAKFLGHSTHNTAASWLGAFVADEILIEIEKGNATTGKASRYRWKH